MAFKEGKVCRLELGTNESELLENLILAFPTDYYFHCLLDMADTDELNSLQSQTFAIVEALEAPSGKMVNLPLEVPFLEVENESRKDTVGFT